MVEDVRSVANEPEVITLGLVADVAGELHQGGIGTVGFAGFGDFPFLLFQGRTAHINNDGADFAEDGVGPGGIIAGCKDGDALDFVRERSVADGHGGLLTAVGLKLTHTVVCTAGEGEE